jgi:MFS transporter, PAT family, beta-lactamase induction signal transducer AmpG
MQLAGAALLTAIAIADAGDSIAVMLTATFVLSLVAATQDIATDGLAVELLDPDERGIANGLQVAAYRVGMVVGGGVLLGLRGTVGQRVVFAIMAALTALASVPVALAHEPPIAPPPPPAAPTAKHFLRRPGALRLIAMIFIYKAGESFGSGMLAPFLVDQHLGESQIAWIRGTAGSAAGVAGAMLGGALVGWIGRRRSLVVFGIGQAVTVAGYAYLALVTPSTFELYAWCSIEPLASGAATAALFTCMMDWSERFSSGTDYTVQASTVVIAQIGFATLSGFSARAFGYAVHFELATAMCVVAVAVVYVLFPKSRTA